MKAPTLIILKALTTLSIHTSHALHCEQGQIFGKDDEGKPMCVDADECDNEIFNQCIDYVTIGFETNDGISCKNTVGSYECECDRSKGLVRKTIEANSACTTFDALKKEKCPDGSKKGM